MLDDIVFHLNRAHALRTLSRFRKEQKCLIKEYGLQVELAEQVVGESWKGSCKTDLVGYYIRIGAKNPDLVREKIPKTYWRVDFLVVRQESS